VLIYSKIGWLFSRKKEKKSVFHIYKLDVFINTWKCAKKIGWDFSRKKSKHSIQKIMFYLFVLVWEKSF